MPLTCWSQRGLRSQLRCFPTSTRCPRRLSLTFAGNVQPTGRTRSFYGYVVFWELLFVGPPHEYRLRACDNHFLSYPAAAAAAPFPRCPHSLQHLFDQSGVPIIDETGTSPSMDPVSPSTLPAAVSVPESRPLRSVSIAEPAYPNAWHCADVLTPDRLSTAVPPLFIIGDSHSLSIAWRHLRWRGQRRVVVPRVVTGLKVSWW